MSRDPHALVGLVLIGLSGVGKSAVGARVARRLGRAFVDTDAEIEAGAGMTIGTILRKLGKTAYHDREEHVLDRLMTTQPKAVLATGSDIVFRTANRRKLRAFGFVVCLSADPAVIADRLRANPRDYDMWPQPPNADELFTENLKARAPLFREVADAIVETNHRTPDEVAVAVVEVWRDARS